MVFQSKIYKKRDRWVECDVCGFDYRFSVMRKGVSGTQKGFNVCPVDFDEPHPLDNKPKLRKRQKLQRVK